jgi:DNA primase
MGSSLSASQERVLTERFERVLLMLDGDAAGRVASRVIGARLSETSSVALVKVPEGAQPDQLSPRIIQDLILQATRPAEAELIAGEKWVLTDFRVHLPPTQKNS